jgi:diguanylate cyclase (GGDEF)-like protein/PAS domain S-box-containing protein
VNQKFCDMLGYTRNELLALRSNEVTHSDEQEPEPGDARALAGEIDTYSGEKRYVRKDGSLLWTNRTVSLARDPDGQPLYFIHVVEDISERKRGESALRKQNGLRVLLESLAIAANQAATPEQALRACLSRICSYGKWPIGHVLMFADADYSTAGQTSLWHFGDAERYAEFKRISDPLVIDPDGGGFLARCMASRRPLWITDLSELEDFKRKQVALALGLKTAFVFPVVTGNRVVACLEFFSDLALEPDTALLDVTTNIGAQLGRVDERRQAGRALRESEEQFQQLANNIPQMCWITDASQREVVFLSPAFETITGLAVEAAKANSRLLVKVVHPDDRQRIQAARRNAAIGGYDETFRLVRPDGSIRWVHDRAFPIRHANGEVYRIAGIAEDITGRKHSDERVLHLAHHDALTNLPNRELFYDRVEHALGQAQRRNWTIGVMFIDLDRFKAVNDTLGHGVGDQLLLQAASRLAQCVRADDTVGRLGGDEFAVILSELAREHDGSVVAQKIIDAMAKPFLIDSHEVFITASIGIATCLSGTSNADTLMSNADAAMYDAKKMGKNNYQFYTAAMNERSMEKLLLGKDLRHALARNEFVLHFQPKANLHGGHITGVEALLRWQRPDGRLVQPLEFIPVLEESGLIVLAGEWVLRAACAQINAWQKDGVTLLPIAINLSAKQFHQQDIVAMVMRALLEYDVNPGLLEFEITESAAMHDAKATSATLHKLKALGVRIAIDDFGTGYSSLSYLKRFPIDSLKIDRSFVTDLPGNQDDASIAQAVITMAHALRLKVIAEGVENEAQLEFLAAQGCDEMQGHYFSPPLPAEACAQLIREQRKLPWRPAHDRRLEQGVLTVVV